MGENEGTGHTGGSTECRTVLQTWEISDTQVDQLIMIMIMIMIMIDYEYHNHGHDYDLIWSWLIMNMIIIMIMIMIMIIIIIIILGTRRWPLACPPPASLTTSIVNTTSGD